MTDNSDVDGNSRLDIRVDPPSVGNRRPLLVPASTIDRPEPSERPTRSRSRARESDAEPPGDVAMDDPNKRQEIQAIKELVEKELDNVVSGDISKHIKKITLELSSKILALQRTKARLDKVKEEITMLQDGRIPNGIRKVTIPLRRRSWTLKCLQKI